MLNINKGEGTLGMLIKDTTTAINLSETMFHLNKSSQSLDENMEALKHNFLFRGYFKRKAKEEARVKIQVALDSLANAKKQLDSLPK